MLLSEIVEIITQANLDPSIKDFKLTHMVTDNKYSYTQDNQIKEDYSEQERCI